MCSRVPQTVGARARRPAHGLIFLFKWREDADTSSEVDPADAPNVYFANQVWPASGAGAWATRCWASTDGPCRLRGQVIENACATQAILSIVLNRPEVDIGPDLRHYKDFTKDFPAPVRCRLRFAD